MRRVHLSISGSTRTVVTAAWGLACLCVLAAPFLAAHSRATAASILYLLFSRICHQIPERSFELFGYPLAVCHRCFGIYAGLFVGCFADIAAIHRSTRIRRHWVLGAIVPLAFDALAPLTGLYSGSALNRFITGALFGFLISSLLVRGLVEFAHEASWRRCAMQSPQPKGDIS